MNGRERPRKTFIPTLEPTAKLVAQLEEFFTNDTLRILILVRVLKDLHKAVPANQIIRKPIEIIIPSVLEPQEPVVNLEDKLQEGFENTKQAIANTVDNEYWRFVLAREMLMMTVQKQLAKEGKELYFSLGSDLNDDFYQIELSDLIDPPIWYPLK